MFSVARLVEHNSRIAVLSEPTRHHGGNRFEFGTPRRVHTVGMHNTSLFRAFYLEKRRYYSFKRRSW